MLAALITVTASTRSIALAVSDDRRFPLSPVHGGRPVFRLQPSDHLIDRVERFGKLTDVASSVLRHIAMTKRTLEPDDYIVREADGLKTCAILVSGYAYRQKITGQGSRQILAICLPGEVVELENLYLDIADHSIQMLTEGEVLTFPRQALQRAIQDHPDVARAVLLDTSLHASIMREWITNNGQRNAKTRLAHLFCELAVRRSMSVSAEPMLFDIPMNQEHLGDMLGLTSAHVNRMLRELTEAGLVSWSRHSVRVLDWPKLRTIADFNSRYLHLDQLVAA